MKIGKPIKIIIDTNIWISFLIGKELSGLKSLIVDEKVILIFCDQILDEIRITTKHPKLKKYFPKEKVEELINLLKVIGLRVIPKSNINKCRDRKDNFLLSLAKDARADYLITGDKDLLTLKEFEYTKIKNYKDFRKLFESLF